MIMQYDDYEYTFQMSEECEKNVSSIACFSSCTSMDNVSIETSAQHKITNIDGGSVSLFVAINLIII